MKHLTTIFITFTIFFSPNTVSEWVQFDRLEEGGGVYLEIDTIKESEGFVYYWGMQDWLVPSESGSLSVQVYYQGDCNKMRVKTLSYVFYTRNMGRGQSDQQESVNKNWKYPSPGTAAIGTLVTACAHIN